MPDSNLVANHYTHGSLVDAIRDGIQKLGKTIDSVDIDDLGPVDEFHIGGRIATDVSLPSNSSRSFSLKRRVLRVLLPWAFTF